MDGEDCPVTTAWQIVTGHAADAGGMSATATGDAGYIRQLR